MQQDQFFPQDIRPSEAKHQEREGLSRKQNSDEKNKIRSLLNLVTGNIIKV